MTVLLVAGVYFVTLLLLRLAALFSPVSYTHLDVYKRQLVLLVGGTFGGLGGFVHGFHLVTPLGGCLLYTSYLL